MAVKSVDNSVLDSVKDLAEVEVPESFLQNRLEGWRFYSTALETLSKPFQAPQERTNDRIDSLILLDWATKREHVFVVFNKEKIEKVAFQPNYGPSEEATNFYTVISEHISNWFDDVLELKSIKRFRLASSETVNRIKEFAFLDDNWDSYGAKAIRWSTIVRAIEFFSRVVFMFPDAPLPFVVPGPNGDIHFEWETCSKVLKHSIPEDENDTFEYLLIDKTSGKVEKTYGRVYNMEEMLDTAAYWMRQKT